MENRTEETSLVKYNSNMNEIIFKDFTDRDFNLLMAIVSRVSGKGTTDKIVLDYKTLKILAGFENKKITNIEFTKILAKMNEKLIQCFCRVQDGDDEIDFVLFPTFTRNAVKAQLTVKVSDEIGYILNDFNSYTGLELKRFVRIKSTYTKTLYRKLRQFKRSGEYHVSVDDFRREFLVPETYRQCDIQRRIIKPAIQELQKDFKNLECIPHHKAEKGRPIDRYLFKFQSPEQIEGQTTITDALNTMTKYKATKAKQSINQIKSQAKKNSFNNFQQNSYDFESLEKQLLDN